MLGLQAWSSEGFESRLALYHTRRRYEQSFGTYGLAINDASATRHSFVAPILLPRWTARLEIGNNTRFLRDYPSTPCALRKAVQVSNSGYRQRWRASISLLLNDRKESHNRGTIADLNYQPANSLLGGLAYLAYQKEN